MQEVYKTLYCDVAVIGGGTGGCAAAIEAARRGMHTILFERGTSLGGLATNGYVPQIAGGIEGICLEFARKLDAMGQLKKKDPAKDYYRNPSFEPEYGKIVLEDMLFGAGSRIVYDCTCIRVDVEGSDIDCVYFYTKAGLLPETAVTTSIRRSLTHSVFPKVPHSLSAVCFWASVTEAPAHMPVMPSPILAGVFGMMRTIFVPSPSADSRSAIVLPAAIEMTRVSFLRDPLICGSTKGRTNGFTARNRTSANAAAAALSPASIPVISRISARVSGLAADAMTHTSGARSLSAIP